MEAATDAATEAGADAGDPCDADPGNDDREHATPYVLGTAVRVCLQDGADVDFYEFTAPATPAQGGFVTVRITDVGTTGNVDAMAYLVADNGEIQGSYNAQEGQSSFFFFAAAPGQKYRVRVKHFTNATQPTPYTFTVTYTGVPDANEPNNSKAQATPLTVGTAGHGYIFAGYTASTGIDDAAFEDWFKVTLAAGTASVQLTDIASDSTASFTLQNSLGQEVASDYEATDGASVVANNITIDDAGDHYLKVNFFARPKLKGDGNVLPSFSSMPYSIKVVQ